MNAKPVIETFYSLKFPKEVFPNGISLHKVAGMIFGDLERRFGKGTSLSIHTIKRVLQNDENIWKQFKIKGRNYFFEQM